MRLKLAVGRHFTTLISGLHVGESYGSRAFLVKCGAHPGHAWSLITPKASLPRPAAWVHGQRATAHLQRCGSHPLQAAGGCAWVLAVFFVRFWVCQRGGRHLLQPLVLGAQGAAIRHLWRLWRLKRLHTGACQRRFLVPELGLPHRGCADDVGGPCGEGAGVEGSRVSRGEGSPGKVRAGKGR